MKTELHKLKKEVFINIAYLQWEQLIHFTSDRTTLGWTHSMDSEWGSPLCLLSSRLQSTRGNNNISALPVRDKLSISGFGGVECDFFENWVSHLEAS